MSTQAIRTEGPDAIGEALLGEYLSDVGPAGIVLFEPAPPFRVLATNRAYRELWPEPLRSDGLVGLALEEFAPELEESGAAAIFGEVARTGRPQELHEFAYQGLGGGTRWFNWSLAPVVRGGRVVALSHMAVEVTREVRARREAEQAARESRSASEILELGDPFCELDAGFRVVRVNAAQERLTGIPRERSIGRTHWELWPDTAQPDSAWWREYHRCMRDRVPVAFENYYAPLDLWSSTTAYPTTGGGIAIFFRDISERKRAEEALRQSEQRLRLFIEHAPAAVAMFDTGMRYLAASRRYVIDYGFPEGTDLTGRSHYEVFPEIPERWKEIHRRCLGGAVEKAEEEAFPRADGSVDWLRWELHPWADAEGRIGGLILFSEVITERKLAREALQESDRRKTEFLAVLSHELRNPLAPIRNGTYLLERAAPGSDQARRARAVIRRQTEHLTRLVDDLLDLTRISRGKIELRRERLDLRDVVRRSMEDARLVFERAEVELLMDVVAEPVWIDADPTRIAQVIGNLLGNAQKFTPAGGRVTVRMELESGAVRLRIRDTGAGMEPGGEERMFEAFAQGDQGVARTKGGLGLGLSLVRSLVELHGGRVSARSEGPARGTEVVVSLPLAAPAGEAAAADGAARAVPREVLVVEDGADAAQSLADVLTLSGHAVRIAASGRAALDAVRALRPEVVLCDIGLPDLDGYTVARALRADPANRDVLLVALTGYAQPEDRQRAAEAGFDAHLPKPPDLARLEELLREVPGAR